MYSLKFIIFENSGQRKIPQKEPSPGMERRAWQGLVSWPGHSSLPIQAWLRPRIPRWAFPVVSPLLGVLVGCLASWFLFTSLLGFIGAELLLHTLLSVFPTRISAPGRGLFSSVLCANTQLLACQAPLSMGLSRQAYWSGLPFPTPWALPDQRIEPMSPASSASPALADQILYHCTTWDALDQRS